VFATSRSPSPARSRDRPPKAPARRIPPWGLATPRPPAPFPFRNPHWEGSAMAPRPRAWVPVGRPGVPLYGRTVVRLYPPRTPPWHALPSRLTPHASRPLDATAQYH
jgi:hypothetical protein